MIDENNRTSVKKVAAKNEPKNIRGRRRVNILKATRTKYRDYSCKKQQKKKKPAYITREIFKWKKFAKQIQLNLFI